MVNDWKFLKNTINTQEVGINFLTICFVVVKFLIVKGNLSKALALVVNKERKL
jgi:hypothetical protein